MVRIPLKKRTLNPALAMSTLRVSFSVAEELTKLDQLRASGSITSAEYARLRGRLV
jgi:hypothetical protein